MAGDHVGFLPEHILVLGRLLGVFDLSGLGALLRRVGDVFGAEFADAAGGLVGADGITQQRE